MGRQRTDDRIPTDLKEVPEGIMSCNLEPIKITKLDKPLSSFGIIERVTALGMSYSERNIVLFKHSKFGKPRSRDNTDLINGYPYGAGKDGVKNLASMMADIKAFTSEFLPEIQKFSEAYFEMENEDFKKLSVLRPTFFGRHLQPPISLEFEKVLFPKTFFDLARRVIQRYVKGNTYTKTGKNAILDGTDAKDTALGSPTFYVGDQFHAARFATMMALPVPDYSKSSAHYIDQVEAFASGFLPDPSLIYASYLSYRQGATAKATPLWYQSGMGFSATHESNGLYTRQRAVWAAPFWLNVLITPLVLRMKSSRKSILGMWHDPEHMARYIPRLQKQGSKAVECDYSGYDTTISNSLLCFFYDELAKAGYSPWEASLMEYVTRQSGAITPSFLGETSSVSYFQGNVTLMSGLLTTSEIGSLISISLILFALSKQRPDLVEAWFAGNFVILVQSDDVLFTYSGPDIDQEKFAADLKLIGITAKLKEGYTFLKRFLPLAGMPYTKPFSRNIQQTFGNEDNYDGKPDAILRLALSARCDTLQNHPLFKKFWPKLLDIYESHFDYVKGAELKEWRNGSFSLSTADYRAIQQYADSVDGKDMFTNLLERAQYDPSAANLLHLLNQHDLSLEFLHADQVKARAEYTRALFTQSDASSQAQMLSFARWATS